MNTYLSIELYYILVILVIDNLTSTHFNPINLFHKLISKIGIY